MYNIVKVVEKHGKRIGFILKDVKTGAESYFSEEDTKDLCNKGLVINVKYTGKQFRKRQGNMSDFDTVTYESKFSTKNKTNKEDIRITSKYSWRYGDSLKSYVSSALKGINEERDFVRRVLRYCKGSSRKVYAISGLRSTGKSVGMRQCIRGLNMYGKTAYIQFTRGKDVSFDELIAILKELPKEVKYIFIDEISVVKDLVHCSGSLADNFTLAGKKVVIAGTDSYSLECAFSDGLFHRCELDNITFISYQEYKRTIKEDFKGYLTSGGLYEASSYTNATGLRSYIDTSIAGNITTTITKNKLSEFNGFSEDEVRSAVYLVLYSIVYSNSKKLPFKRVVNMVLSDSKAENIDRLTLDRVISQSLGVNIGSNLSMVLIQRVLIALEYMGIILKCSNICKNNEFIETNYYLVSPYLSNNIYSTIFDLLIAEGGTVKDKKFNSIFGLVLESALVAHAVKQSNMDCYFYHNKISNSEVDLVLMERQSLDVDEKSKVHLVEIKLSPNPEYVCKKGHWVMEVEEDTFNEDVEIVSRNIVYMGRTVNSKGLINCMKFIKNISKLKDIL